MRKRYRDFKSHDENVFAVSTGDLMASLLFIFILLLVGALLQVQEKSEQDERIAGAYNEIKEKIYEALKAEFSPEELREWHARIDRDTLTILFQEPRIAFEEGEYKIKPRFQKMLDDFFPRYVNVLLSRDSGGEICPESGDAACPGAKEDQELSKRVEFRVRTDAERQLEDIAERRKQGSR